MDQKIKVCNNIKTFQDEINKKIEQVRDQILIKLDSQLVIFKKNFESYEEKIQNTFLSPDDQASNIYSEESIASDLNNSRSALDLASKVKSYILDIDESKNILGLDRDERELALLKSIKSYSDKINNSIKNQVIIESTSNMNESSTFKEFTKLLENCLKDMTRIKNELRYLKEEVSSELLSDCDLPFIREVVNKGNIKLKPIYFGTISSNDIQINKIGDLWSNRSHLICLVKWKGVKNIIGIYKESPGFDSPTMTVDIARKFKHPTQYPGSVELNKTLHLNHILVLRLPPAKSTNRMMDHVVQGLKYQMTLEDFEEMDLDGYLLESVEILEIDFLGKKENEKSSCVELDNSITTKLAYHYQKCDKY